VNTAIQKRSDLHQVPAIQVSQTPHTVKTPKPTPFKYNSSSQRQGLWFVAFVKHAKKIETAKISSLGSPFSSPISSHDWLSERRTGSSKRTCGHSRDSQDSRRLGRQVDSRKDWCCQFFSVLFLTHSCLSFSPSIFRSLSKLSYVVKLR
jgi:hypothetical protein